jgi:hypothetical protein
MVQMQSWDREAVVRGGGAAKRGERGVRRGAVKSAGRRTRSATGASLGVVAEGAAARRSALSRWIEHPQPASAADADPQGTASAEAGESQQSQGAAPRTGVSMPQGLFA